MKPTGLLLLHLVAVVLGGSVPAAEIPIHSGIGRETLDARSDTDEAGVYLQWLTAPSQPAERDALPPLSQELALLDRRAVSSTLDRDELHALTRRHSVDLATLLFARSIVTKPENAEIQEIFDAERVRLQERATVARSGRTDHPTVMFAPGFLYRSHPETGGDFAIPRRQLSSLGIANQLIETDEAGSVEDNARQIAAAVRMRRDDPIILVSASKAGPEVALALGGLLAPEEARSVAAWINIGGLLGGSPLADQALRPSRRWLVRLALWWKGLEVEGVRSLRTSESRRRLDGLSFSTELQVVNVVAAPLSGDLSNRAADGYRKLRQLGPNDGLALLADQVLPGSRTLVLVGDDHFFTRHDPRLLTLSLLAVARHLIDSRSEGGGEGPLDSHGGRRLYSTYPLNS